MNQFGRPVSDRLRAKQSFAGRISDELEVAVGGSLNVGPRDLGEFGAANSTVVGHVLRLDSHLGDFRNREDAHGNDGPRRRDVQAEGVTGCAAALDGGRGGEPGPDHDIPGCIQTGNPRLTPLVHGNPPAGVELDTGLVKIEAPRIGHAPGRNQCLLGGEYLAAAELGDDAGEYDLRVPSDDESMVRYTMHTLPSAIDTTIGTSTLFAAWNAAIYVAQIDDERLEEAMADGSYLETTASFLQESDGLWFNDETFVVRRL